MKQKLNTEIMENTLAIFEDYKIRRHFDEETDTWYFSSELVIICHQLKSEGRI